MTFITPIKIRDIKTISNIKNMLDSAISVKNVKSSLANAHLKNDLIHIKYNFLEIYSHIYEHTSCSFEITQSDSERKPYSYKRREFKWFIIILQRSYGYSFHLNYYSRRSLQM